jgi:glycosyltransferase involved in cell wall biosynthesis
MSAHLPGPVWLYNPLPEALKHYEGALLDVLSAAGVPARSAGAPSIEVHGASKWQRARAAAAELAAHRRAGRGGHLIVLWPTYGLLEPALWLPSWRAGRVSIVIHDPSPLRRQLGMGPVAASLGGRAARASHLRVVAHSETAADTLRANGWASPELLPHPLLRARPRAQPVPADRGTVLVCGQYKPARNVELLVALGPQLRRAGYRAVIAGRGWPAVPGWEVIDRFLTETELDERMGRSAAVLIPYSHFYQSGIAVRAVELGVPVVGPEHPFLAELLGPGWPGLVAGEDAADWVAGVNAVAGQADRLAHAAAAGRDRCERAWADYLRPAGVPVHT